MLRGAKGVKGGLLMAANVAYGSSSREGSMSALPSTADFHQGDGYVSFVPISDIAFT